ncbi:unnamed protein product [Adineta steineri]|nr:unnamed protein product [Adineta steineri]CAF0770473.1 unnamed protein product [Adineta steineri]CAF0773533.1 unnamed protein product [Adineta steineri]CAF0815775.1 unnamed protein product [Adineta steineri]CAF3597824.1 unnamed protein product [Adineta steineri]
MASGYACQHCSQLPPPPPMFAIGPPPNILSIDTRCSSRSLSLTSIETKKAVSSLSSLSSVSIILGIIIALLITLTTIVLIKKRRQRHKTKCNNRMMINSSSVRYNRHHQYNNNNHHHRHQNWTTCVPLLSDSCSSDQTSSTPPNEYPCTNGVIEPLLNRDVTHHDYEQIKCDDSSSGSLHYYCLIYCRQCANYHPTSSSSSSSSSSCPRSNPIRPCHLPISTNPTCQHQCACYHRTYYQRNDNRFFELQPMLMTRIDNNSEDSNNHLKFIEESPPI